MGNVVDDICCDFSFFLLVFFFRFVISSVVEAHSEMSLFTANAISTILAISLGIIFSSSLLSQRSVNKHKEFQLIDTFVCLCMRATASNVCTNERERRGGICFGVYVASVSMYLFETSDGAFRFEMFASRYPFQCIFFVFWDFDRMLTTMGNMYILCPAFIRRAKIKTKLSDWRLLRCERHLIDEFIAQTLIRHSICLLLFCIVRWYGCVSFRWQCIVSWNGISCIRHPFGQTMTYY